MYSAGNHNDLPPLRMRLCTPARREPALILFNVRGDPRPAEGGAIGGWLISLDQIGNLTCILRSPLPIQGVRQYANGNILVTIADGLLLETTLAGTILRQWYATGRYRGRTPPESGIPVNAETFHHGVNIGPNGNLLLLSMEIREFDNWPSSVTDPNAPKERTKLVGDVVMEVAPDGSKVNEWRILDMLDPYRITYGSRSKYWQQRGYPGTMDWCHANSIVYDPRDDCIVLSLRAQDCIIKFERKSGTLRWILGSHGNWRAPWSDKLLQKSDPGGWQFHQHDCSITPAGTIMCFDNGNYRSLPYVPPLSAEQNYSRAVEFAVDEGNRTAKQVWSYGEAFDERLFAGFQGGALRLPKTGNSFITYGGICSNDGKPWDGPDRTDIRARLVEVSPDNEIVLDLHIGGKLGDPRALSVFRSELYSP